MCRPRERVSHFGSSPDGDPSADPDNDGRDNRREFLELTDVAAAAVLPNRAVQMSLPLPGVVVALQAQVPLARNQHRRGEASVG